MFQSESWSSLPPRHVGRDAPKLAPSAMVSCDIQSWVHGAHHSWRGWLGCHQQIANETSANGSSSDACVPTCSDIQLLLNIFRPSRQRHRVCTSSSNQLILIWGAESKLFCFMILRSAYVYFDVIIFNRCPCGPSVRLLLSWIGLLDATMWHSNKSRHLPLKKPKTWEKNIFRNYRPDTGTFVTWLPFWFEMTICKQRRLTTVCDDYKCAMVLFFGGVGGGGERWVNSGKSRLPRRKNADQDWTKLIVDHRHLDLEGSFEYIKEHYNYLSKNFHQLWGKTVALVRWIHTIGEQCNSSMP